MGDEGAIELGPPLPGLADSATITFFAPKQGLLGRPRAVQRAEADRAVLSLRSGRDTEERELTLAEVDAWLAEVEAFRARVRTRRAENEAARSTAAEHAAARAERRAAIRPTCPYCSVPRDYQGRRHLVTSAKPEGMAHADPAYWSAGFEAAHLYRCPRCGSIEWFAVGPLEHPLG